MRELNKLFIFLLFNYFYISEVKCGGCVVEPPLNDDSPQIGLIFVPGATIPGENYLPLMKAVQANYPGSLWIAATKEWTGEMPNPLEVGGQLQGCKDMAAQFGLDTTNVFYAGHSLGGIVLENYVSGHFDETLGIALLGTWLPNLLEKSDDWTRNNEYPVPVLTAIGEIDGGGISYLRREVEETKVLANSVRSFTKTIMVPQVNHAQVASGEVDQGVVDNDIDAEISEEDAHNNYGIRVADWLALSALHLELLDGSQAQQSLLNFVQYEKETEEFLEPFKTMYHLEQEGYVSQYVSDMQATIIGEDYLTDDMIITNSILTNELTFQGYDPLVNIYENGTIQIKTWSHMLYDTDPLDFNNHLSARTIKAKMKLADYIYEKVLGIEGKDNVVECGELNRQTLALAMELASDAAIDRWALRGRSLTFGPDNDYIWGIGLWELSGGIKWKIIDDKNVELTGSRLWSNPDFLIYPGEHYCDLLSPYRALEWIYIESIRHTMQF